MHHDKVAGVGGNQILSTILDLHPEPHQATTPLEPLDPPRPPVERASAGQVQRLGVEPLPLVQDRRRLRAQTAAGQRPGPVLMAHRAGDVEVAGEPPSLRERSLRQMAQDRIQRRRAQAHLSRNRSSQHVEVFHVGVDSVPDEDRFARDPPVGAGAVDVQPEIEGRLRMIEPAPGKRLVVDVEVRRANDPRNAEGVARGFRGHVHREGARELQARRLDAEEIQGQASLQGELFDLRRP